MSLFTMGTQTWNDMGKIGKTKSGKVENKNCRE